MTQASTLKFSQFTILLGDGASPEVFARPCGLNSRSFNRTANTNETNVPDCDDEDAPASLERDVVSKSASISGSGVVADEDYDTWDAWYETGDSKNCKVTLGTRTWIGAYKLTKLNTTGSRGSRVTFDATLDSDGDVARQ